MANRLVLVIAVSLTSIAVAEIFDRPSNYVYTIVCDPRLEEDCQSELLETIATNTQGSEQTDVHIDIAIPHLYLNAPVKFTDLKSLIIKGNSTFINCTASANSSAGVQLSRIADAVKLSNLILNSCGIEIQRGKIIKTYVSALIILSCSNVELTGIVIEKSNGIGLMILNHTGGRVSIISALFAENVLSQKHGNGTGLKKRLFGGGGVYMTFSKGPMYPTTILFENCTFENNTSNNAHYKLSYTDFKLGDTHENNGNGGGVNMEFGGGSVDIHVTFISCYFIGNKAFIGGGLSAQIYRKNSLNINNITLRIIDSEFQQNGCTNSKFTVTVLGGAMYIRFESATGAGITNSHFIARNVTFIGNCADLGGGVYYYSHHDRLHSDYSHNSVQFEDSKFIGNRAHAGSALVMIPDLFLKRYRGYKIVPVFQSCQFLSNSVSVRHSWTKWTRTIPGVGTVYVSLSDISFQGCIVFEHNWGTALHAVNGVMDFQNSNVSFVNNTGLQGGAVALLGLAKIIMGSNLNYEFINNHALFLGGALYVSSTDITEFVSKSCFIQYADNDSANISIPWEANITFIGNRAKDNTSGHAIYATSLLPCQTIRYHGTSNQFHYLVIDNISEIFTKRGMKFDNDTKLQPQLATDGATLSFNQSTPLMIIPGEYYEHGILTTNDLGQTTKPSFRVAIITNNASNNSIQLDSAFIGDELQLTGEPGETATLHFEILSPRQSYLRLTVMLVECPPGFKFGNDSKCVCNTHNHMGMLRCNEDEFHSYLLPGFWIGFIDSKLVTSVCPFCLTESKLEIALPRNSAELDGILCGETRTGTACGKCRDNYTVYFHSPDFLCRPAEHVGCKLGWLFYFLSELIPVTVVFIVVLSFNISFTSGAVNGFILYSQLLGSLDISASGIIHVAVSDTRIGKVALALYGFFNLDLLGSGLSFCLWKGASALDMIAIKYITIIYAILLILAVTWTINRCGGRYLGKYCRITTVKASVIHGISSFLVISYAQCIKVSLSLLLRLHIHPEYGSGFKVQPRVWYNGEMVHFSKEHLPYALPALLCLLTVGALPPVLLLTYPLLNKLLDCLGLDDNKCINLVCAILPIGSLKPLLDSFQGCFKDEFRFFAGLYFLYRWLFPLVHFNTELYSIYYTSISGSLVAILTLHTICQPYVKRAHNIIDTLLFSNLVLINCLVFFNYHNSQNQTPQYKAIGSAAVVQLVLICLPMMAMCMYLLVVLCKQIFKRTCGGNSQTNFTLVARELVEFVNARKERSVPSTGEVTHDRLSLVDEDIEYRNTYSCFEDGETQPDLYSY